MAALGVFYSLAFLLKTGCTDPGILPRAPADEVEYMQALGDVGNWLRSLFPPPPPNKIESCIVLQRAPILIEELMDSHYYGIAISM